VESPDASKSRFWGITFRISDPDKYPSLLGDRISEFRQAVQPGRRIATFRSEAGLGLPVALISEPRRGDQA